MIPEKTSAAGLTLPVLGLGTLGIGGRGRAAADNDDQLDIQVIRNALRSGISYISTAEFFAQGRTEELIGQAIKSLNNSAIKISSKLGVGKQRAFQVAPAVERSLRRLNRDRLDLCMVHLPNPSISIRETMHALNELVSQGLVRHIGLAYFNREQVIEARKFARTGIAAVQAHYSVKARTVEQDGLLKYCQDNDILFLACRPLENGRLAQEHDDFLHAIAQRYHCSPVQIAINWLSSQPKVVVVCKTQNVQHLKENIAAVGWQMEDDEIEYIRAQYPDQKFETDAAVNM